ncbi:MAG: CARDB domain-containing protein, partial [Candidatus Cloacimonas acidaminovorans]|nr:CARDB domain-containing protein [Candidatus Cloacimonas acidaminovorans]
MKRLSLLLVMIITMCVAFAGIDEYYTFNATSGTYTSIVGTNAGISNNNVISAAIPIGFSFPYGDDIYNEVKISSNGWIGLGTSQTGSNLNNNLTSTSYVPVVAPLWDDCSLAAGSCEYLLSGTAPNRIFTIQYTNLKWRYSATTLFNLQARLYENGKIDFVYGSSTGDPAYPSASIGINVLPGGSGWFYSITPGTPATASTTLENATIAAWPGEGTIYEFNPVAPVPNDLAARSITGNTTPTAEQSYDYVITVRNRGTNPQSTYQVKLLLGTQEIGSVNGTTIQAGEILTFTISWTPSTAGPATLYGKVVLAGDENTTNDQTPPLNIAVQPAGVQAVTIGAGDELAMVPMNFYHMNSLYECLFYPDELGFTSGTITSLAFYNNFADSPANGATRIWLGTTTQPNLSNGWVPSTELSLVFDGNVNYPIGINTIIIPLQTPFMYNSGNLVMMVHRPMDTQYYSDTDYFLAQTIGNNRARIAKRDVVNNFNPANPPSQFTALNGQFPKTTIFYSTQPIVNDLSCLDIIGNITPSAGSETQYTITVKNNGTATQSNYTVKLIKEGGILINSVPGTPINAMQTLNFIINWTPGESGSTYIYGEVELTGDEIADNNQTKQQNINVYSAGIIAKTVGMGNCIGQLPVTFYWKNSVSETIYLASEINGSGLITDIQYYNNFVSDLTGKPTNIWMGETIETNLSDGWIPCTQLTSVFSGTVDYPAGPNNITIHLTTPYNYNGSNLVVMVERPWDNYYYPSANVFLLHMGTEICRTLEIAGDFEDYDPANPPDIIDVNIEDIIPVTTFIFNTSNMVTVSGRIVGSDQPTVGLANATITLTGYENYETTTNATGYFTINNVYANHTYDYVAHATGYQSAVGQVIVGSNDVNMGDIVLNEIAIPPYQAIATEVPGGSIINLTWMAPNPDAVGEWLHYDNGQNYASIGTNSAADFDVAIRFPASALQDYVGMSLYAVKAWPAQVGSFSIRVWTGGNASAPGPMVVDQSFTPILNTYNTVMLNDPVNITGTEELWFGYRCNVTGGYPAGCDSGPAVDGFGDMMYFQGSWNT